MSAPKGTAQAFVESMRKFIGTTEQPPGSNYNSVTRWYDNHTHIGARQPWCDETVTMAAFDSETQAAVTYGGYFAYTVAHASAARQHNDYHVGTSGIRAGDVIFYQWEGGSKSIAKIDHVGVVEYVSGNTIHTIEGNRGDKCARYTVKKGSPVVAGYMRPRFKGATPAPKKEDEEMAERVSLTHTKDVALATDGTWNTIRFDRVNQDTGKNRKADGKMYPGIVNKPSWATATFECILKGSKMAPGQSLGQVRFIIVNPKTGKIMHKYNPQEIVATSGAQYVVHTRVGMWVGKNQHLYAQVVLWTNDKITMTEADVTATYKEV